MTQSLKTFDVLGTPLVATSYEQFTAFCQELAQRGGTYAIDFTNTQIVTLRRHDRQFREVTTKFDYFIPDGMPLIWCMNAGGAALPDRVYGPSFMRYCLERNPAPWTHYLLGGSEQCGLRLRARFPQVRFVGSFHGACNNEGIFIGTGDNQVLDEINHVSPDFIWIGLGTPKQHKWIARQKGSISRGVIFGAGFAFDVNAGLKKDAPRWMQRSGLTWLFRILTEPRRLFGRYLRYNTLFLYYLVRDALIPANR